MQQNKEYLNFLKNKVTIADLCGFEIEESGGIMSVPYRAILKGRKSIATELSTRYFMNGVHYLQAAEREMSMPDLFATLDTEREAA